MVTLFVEPPIVVWSHVHVYSFLQDVPNNATAANNNTNFFILFVLIVNNFQYKYMLPFIEKKTCS
jgi:hypothetical protein